MRHVRLVAQVVALAALAGGCLDSGSSSTDCVKHEQTTLSASTPYDPPLLYQVDSCRVDVDACPALCRVMLSRVHPTGVSVTSCQVSFSGGTTTADIKFEQDVNSTACLPTDPPTAGGL